MTPGIDLTPQEAERLRQILDAYQTKNPQSIKEFDLANPPTKPYRHQEYPLAMFNHETGEEKQARSRDDEDVLAGRGFSRECVPLTESPIQIELTEDEKATIAAAEADRKNPKKNKGN